MTTATATLDYKYGDTVTTLTLPLPNPYSYTKGQQALVGTAVANGWTLDVTAVLNTSRGSFERYSTEDKLRHLVQHPFKFVRPAADGGRWEIELDYRDRDYSWYGSRSFNATLKGAKLYRFAADGKQVFYDAQVSAWTGSQGGLVLEKQSTASYASVNYVTAVTPGTNLREQVTALLADPEGIADEAVAALAVAEAAEYAEREEKRRIEALKARPLTPSWWELKAAARAVAESDGTSDAAALLAALKAAVALVEDEVVVR